MLSGVEHENKFYNLGDSTSSEIQYNIIIGMVDSNIVRARR